MNNHLNAAKASLLLLDSDLSHLKKKDQRNYMQADSGALGKYLASAYNCGAEKTVRAIRSHKGFWEQKVPSETKMYLKKFSAVWNSLIGA